MVLVNFIYSLNTETQCFLVMIGIFTLIFHLTYRASTPEKAPAFLTTLGILGTFIGIALGLKDFNTSDIQRSVPDLIEGIKTAVWASAFGIFCALTIKLRDIEGFVRKKKPAKKTVSAEDLIDALKSLERALLNREPVKPVEIPAPIIAEARIEHPDMRELRTSPNQF